MNMGSGMRVVKIHSSKYYMEYVYVMQRLWEGGMRTMKRGGVIVRNEDIRSIHVNLCFWSI